MTKSKIFPHLSTTYFLSNSLIVRKDYYRRSRDLMYIFSGVVYLLNIIDAYVDAHLANFDVGDNLTLRASPVMQVTYSSQPIASMALSLSFSPPTPQRGD